jgi:MFS family permease
VTVILNSFHLSRPQIPILLCAFVTLLNDRLGETVLLPLLPYLPGRFTDSGTILGLLGGTYALAQFAVVPLIGSLSDRFGRKPVLTACVAGSVIGLGLFAITVWIDWNILPAAWLGIVPLVLLFSARIIDGFSGGTASSATAVLADISTPESRAKVFGLIGVAFGLGFILGPFIGGRLAEINIALPGLAATAFAVFNLLLVIYILPETHPPAARNSLPSKSKLNPITQIAQIFANQLVRRLCLAFFLFFRAFNGFTNVLVLYLKQTFSWTVSLASLTFAVVGLIAMVVQGLLIGPLVKSFGEWRLTIAGIGFVIAGCLLLPLATKQNSISVVFTAVSVLAIGTGLVVPCLRALVSRRLNNSGQGAVLGSLQSLQSLGTFLGAAVAGFAYDQIGPRSPFWLASLVLAGVIALVAGGLPGSSGQTRFQES